MSFMFNPHPYDDITAVNRPVMNTASIEQTIFGTKETIAQMVSDIEKSSRDGGCIVAVDGYVSADFSVLIYDIEKRLASRGYKVTLFDMKDFYLSSEILERKFSEYLPEDRVKDPVLLYGRLYEGGYETVCDEEKLEAAKRGMFACKRREETAIVFGQGCAMAGLRSIYDYIAYMDVTPKQVMLRAHAKKWKNIGDDKDRTVKEIQRRAYYMDFELAANLRGELLMDNVLDAYIAGDHAEKLVFVPNTALNDMLVNLVKYPFRCKPVYLEGVWGGYYVHKIRKLPDVFKNIAWVFDLIPMEVSLLIEVGTELLEIPFYTLVQKMGEDIMGRECVERFGMKFPIRFNYDDTFHSSGNMSVQVHPPREYCMENFNELGTQDEGYYIIAAGHDAVTYCGLKEDADPDEFFEKVRDSEINKTEIDYKKYINAVPSIPGRQFLIPGGTVHASGRNQLILEIGSLTVGSYTFKLYDYLRRDLDGNPRPIHSYHGEKVLDKNCKSSFVQKRLVQEPVAVREGDGFCENIVGEDELVYYSTRQLKFDRQISDDTMGKFHVLALVDGEKVIVESNADPGKCYCMSYLDIIVVPAAIGGYTIRNQGNQPVVVYKVCVK